MCRGHPCYLDHSFGQHCLQIPITLESPVHFETRQQYGPYAAQQTHKCITDVNGCAASGTKNFAKGMCQPCYLHYLETSGGHLHGAHPPAYVRALRLADEEWQRRVGPAVLIQLFELRLVQVMAAWWCVLLRVCFHPRGVGGGLLL